MHLMFVLKKVMKTGFENLTTDQRIRYKAAYIKDILVSDEIHCNGCQVSLKRGGCICVGKK